MRNGSLSGRTAPSAVRGTKGANDITDAMIASIKGMVARGDRQFDIATWWDLPLTHVSNIATGKRGRSVPKAPIESLPPPGPYQVVSVEAHARLQEAAAVPAKTLQEIMTILQNLQKQMARMQPPREEVLDARSPIVPAPRVDTTASPNQLPLPFTISERH